MHIFKVVGLEPNRSSDIVDNDVVLVSTVVENNGVPLNYIEPSTTQLFILEEPRGRRQGTHHCRSVKNGTS